MKKNPKRNQRKRKLLIKKTNEKTQETVNSKKNQLSETRITELEKKLCPAKEQNYTRRKKIGHFGRMSPFEKQIYIQDERRQGPTEIVGEHSKYV